MINYRRLSEASGDNDDDKSVRMSEERMAMVKELAKENGIYERLASALGEPILQRN